MNVLKVAIALCIAFVSAGCSTIQPAKFDFKVVDDASKETVNNSLSSNSPYSGTTMYIFKRNFTKEQPLLRAQECLRYTRLAAPSVWGEAVGEASAQSIWELARDSIVNELNEGKFDETFALKVITRAIFDGGRSGNERGKQKIISLTASCFNLGGGGTGTGSDRWMPSTAGSSPDN